MSISYSATQMDAAREWLIQNPGKSLWFAPCSVLGTVSQTDQEFEDALIKAMMTPLETE